MQVYTAEKIFTGQGAPKTNWAFGVEYGKIRWCGPRRDAPKSENPTIDLGKLVTPGLIDAHIHPLLLADNLGALACIPPKITSIPRLIAQLRQQAATTEGWILGWGWDESLLDEGRAPTRAELDEVSRDRPIYLERSDCHSGLANSAALAMAGIGRTTLNPPDGEIVRDGAGEPTGYLREHGANQMVKGIISRPSPAEKARTLGQLGRVMGEYGLTCVAEMMARSNEGDPHALYQDAVRHGWAQESHLYYVSDAIPADYIFPTEQMRGHIRVSGVKLFLDGALSNETAFLHSKYCGSHAQSGSNGMALCSPSQMRKAEQIARGNGIQLAVHAMGDGAIEALLDNWEDAKPWCEAVPAVRIEHASMLRPDLIARLARAKMEFAVATNMDFFFAEYNSYSTLLDGEQFANCYRVADMYRAVPALALTSDAPATPWAEAFSPFVSIYAAVARRAAGGEDLGQDQAITVSQALELYTSRAAKILPTAQGWIKPGAPACFTALDRDIFTCSHVEILGTRALATYINGENVL
ncbi:MAG: amidohydrolase family protein [Actinomycetaceae bacterium]|nr:amidohydrolase family protein [Actinomycetaceae bacterium]